MNRKRNLTFYFVLFFFLLPIISFGQSVETQSKEVVRKNIFSYGKKITVTGTVTGSVIKIGGSLKLNGKINKDVVCINSKVFVGNNSYIKGDLIVIGGSLTGGNKNNVKGDIYNINFSADKIETSLTPFVFRGKTVNILKALLLILSLIISLIVFGLFPGKIERSEELLNDNVLKIGVLGLLSVIALVVLFVLFAVLSFIYIGVPLLIVLLVFIIGIILFGRTVIYFYIGKKMVEKFNLSIFSPPIFILIGVIVYFILNYLPFIGFIFLKFFSVFEIGIGIGYFFQKRLNLKSVTDFVAGYGINNAKEKKM